MQFAICIEKILDEALSDKMVAVNIVSAVDSYESRDFREAVIRNYMKDPRFRIRTQNVEHLNPLPTGSSRRTSIVDLRDYSEFLIFKSKLTPDIFVYNGYFIIALTKGKIPEIHKIFTELWKLQIHNVIIIFENTDQHLKILTFIPFRSSKDCSNTRPVIVNEFVNGTFKYEMHRIFPPKLQDLHQCEVRVAIADDARPYVYMKRTKNGEKRLHGRDYELIKAIAQGLNFRINFTYIGPYGYIYPNGTTSHIFRVLQDNGADLALGDFWLKPYRLKFFDASMSYSSEQVAFVYPMSKELTPLDRLLYPLELMTWLLLTGYLAIGTVTIFMIQKQSKNVQNFVFGRNIKHPYLNIWIGIFGTTQHRLPGRNFSRFLLMNFLIFMLIIRTAYQGKMYHFLQSNMRHPEPDTIQDLIDSGYEFEFFDGHLDLILDLSRFPKRKITSKNFDYSTYFKNVMKRNLKKTIIAPYSNYVDIIKADKSLKLQFCPETYLVMSSVIYTIKNFYLIDEIDDCIDDMINGGFIQFWHARNLYGHRKPIDVDDNPRTLSFHHLSGCFQLWAGGCVLSTIGFLLELIYCKWKGSSGTKQMRRKP